MKPARTGAVNGLAGTQVARSASGVTDLPASERKTIPRRTDSWAVISPVVSKRGRQQSLTQRLMRLLSRVRLAQCLSGDLAELAGGHVEDEPARRRVLGNERAVLDAVQRLADVLGEVGEGFSRPRRFDAGLVLDRALEVVVGERQHPAVGVVNQNDLGGSP